MFISSDGLKRFPPGDVLSVAPKGAIEALMRGIAREEGRYGIRANNVAVGVVDAGMFPKLVERGELSQEWIDAATRNTPLRRFGTPEEIADAATSNCEETVERMAEMTAASIRPARPAGIPARDTATPVRASTAPAAAR